MNKKKKTDRSSFKHLMALAAPHKGKWFIVIALLIVSSLATAFGPLCLGNVTNSIVTGLNGSGINWSQFYYWSGLSLTAYLMAFVTRFIVARISSKLTAGISYELREDLEKKIWSLPLNYFDTHQRGDIMSRITNDVNNIATSLGSLTDFIYNIIQVFGMLLMMIFISWSLALMSLVLIFLSTYILRVLTGMSRKNYINRSRDLANINSLIEESFNGHDLIRLYGQEENFKNRFKEDNRKLFFSSLYATVLSNVVQPSANFISNLIYTFVAIFGALNVINGVMNIGQIQAFIQYVRDFNTPFSQMASNISSFQIGLASLHQIEELLKEIDEVDEKAGALEHQQLTGQIDFKDVSFSYVPERKLIENMNLSIKPGQTIAIVGETGAGKTTLVNLIERFYEINSGQILLDGKYDLKDLSRQALRENIGMVLQDTWLYEGTVEDNIRYGIPAGRQVSHEEIMEACKATFVDHFVQTMPDGYQTIVNNEQSSISAGEKQLLTIARAFVMKPNILILDEATSSVDTRTEALIQEAINKLREGRTSFVIAHRLSTIRNADIILVMKDGHIVEQGSHEELMKINGAYKQLYNSQFGE